MQCGHPGYPDQAAKLCTVNLGLPDQLLVTVNLEHAAQLLRSVWPSSYCLLGQLLLLTSQLCQLVLDEHWTFAGWLPRACSKCSIGALQTPRTACRLQIHQAHALALIMCGCPGRHAEVQRRLGP